MIPYASSASPSPSLCCSVRKKRWMMKVANDGHKNCCWLDLGDHRAHPRAEKNLPDLKSRQIDHCHKYLHWIMYAKLLMGFWSLFAINDWGISMSDKIHFAKKKKSKFFIWFIDFFRSYFQSYFFAILKKDLWGGESSFEHWIWFWTLFNFGVIVQVNSPPTRWCQKSQKKKPKLSSQKQIWYSRPINYAFPKRSSQKIMEWILKDLDASSDPLKYS